MPGKILVLDPDMNAASLVRHHLETEGFVTTVATTADEFWRGLITDSPDGAVIEIRLPGGEGWPLLGRIRNDGRFYRLAIVVLTSMVDSESVERIAGLGCEYLAKPFSAGALIDKLRLAMRNARDIATPGLQVELRTMPVVILIGEIRVEGLVHVPKELSRFSEAWEATFRDARTFLPITDARVTTPDTALELAETSFLQVRKDQILAVFPRE